MTETERGGEPAHYFDLERRDGAELLVPTEGARGLWGPDMVRGPAITAALSRSLETGFGDDPDLQPARVTFDLHSPVPMRPLAVETRLLREGRRIRLLEAELTVSGRVLARARALLLRRTDERPQPDNPIWTTDGVPEPPSPELAAASPSGRLYRSETTDWSFAMGEHQNPERKSVWLVEKQEIVRGEPSTPFQQAGQSADIANLVANWGGLGGEYINADVTLAISRQPRGDEIGLAALARSEHRGVAIGTAALFDRDGMFATSSVNGLLQPRTRISYEDADRE